MDYKGVKILKLGVSISWHGFVTPLPIFCLKETQKYDNPKRYRRLKIFRSVLFVFSFLFSHPIFINNKLKMELFSNIYKKI